MSVTVEGVAVLARGVAALVADQVDLHEPRHRVVPLAPRSGSGSASFSSDPGLGVRAAPEHAAWPGPAPAGGRSWPPTSPPAAPRSSSSIVQLAEPAQPWAPAPARNGASRLPAGVPMHRPAEPQRRNDHPALRRSAAAAPAAGTTASAPALAAAPYGRGCDASPSSRTARPGSCLFAGPVRPPVTGRDRLRHSPAFDPSSVSMAHTAEAADTTPGGHAATRAFLR